MAGASDVVPGVPVWLFKSSRDCEFRSNMAEGLNLACWICDCKDLKTRI